MKNNLFYSPERKEKFAAVKEAKAGWADAEPMKVLVSAVDNPAVRVIRLTRAVRGLSALINAGIASVHAGVVSATDEHPAHVICNYFRLSSLQMKSLAKQAYLSAFTSVHADSVCRSQIIFKVQMILPLFSGISSALVQ